MSHPSAYIAGPLSIPPSSQPDLSYVDDIYDPNLDPNLLDSEQTTTSVIDPEFTQPALVNSSLQRVGPDRRKQFVLYNAMNNASKVKFIEWWRTTVRGGDQEAQRKVRWDAKHISDIWKGFDQVAHHITGEPMVMCRSCGILLSHPHSKQTGTNSLKRHQNSGKCQKVVTFTNINGNEASCVLNNRLNTGSWCVTVEKRDKTNSPSYSSTSTPSTILTVASLTITSTAIACVTK